MVRGGVFIKVNEFGVMDGGDFFGVFEMRI